MAQLFAARFIIIFAMALQTNTYVRLFVCSLVYLFVCLVCCCCCCCWFFHLYFPFSANFHFSLLPFFHAQTPQAHNLYDPMKRIISNMCANEQQYPIWATVTVTITEQQQKRNTQFSQNFISYLFEFRFFTLILIDIVSKLKFDKS